MSNASWHVSENGLTNNVPGGAEATTHDQRRTAAAQASSSRETLETRLLREGYVTADQLSELVRHHVQTQRPIEELVAELGLVPHAVLEQMLDDSVPPVSSAVDFASLPGKASNHETAQAEAAPAELRALPAWEPVSEPEVAVPVALEPVEDTYVVVADVLPLGASATPSSAPVPAEQPPPLNETSETVDARPPLQTEPTETVVDVSVPTELHSKNATIARVVFDVVVHDRAGREFSAVTRSSRAAAQEDVARFGRALSEGAGAWLETDNWVFRRGAVVAVGIRARLAAD